MLTSAGLVAAIALAFAPVRHHDFIPFDDPQYVVENRHVNSGLSWENVRWAFTAGEQGNWHPLTWLSHMLDVELFGLDAGAHHLTSAALHAIGTVLLLVLLVRLGCDRWRSAAVAALFALHPMHVESVAWVAERKDVLSGVFWWAALLAYVAFVRGRSAARYLLLLGAFAAGLMAKPMVVTLPFVLLLLDLWPLGRMRRADRDVVRPTYGVWPLVREKLPLFAMAAASGVVTFVVQQEGGAVRSLEALSAGRRLETALTGYLFYLARALWPRDLAVLYPYPDAVPIWQLAIAAAALAALTWLALRMARTQPWATVGWFWFAGTLVPVIGLVQIGSQPVADRYSYLPYVGLFILIVWAIAEIVKRRPALRRVTAAGAVVVIAAFAVLAHRQVRHWRDGITLWTHALAVTERNYRAHHGLGAALEAGGRVAEAAAQYEAALRIRPAYVESLNNLAGIRSDQGRLDAAAAYLTTALSVLPDHVESLATFGVVRTRQGRVEEAIRLLERARALRPDSASIRNGLAFALSAAGRFAAARAELEAAVRLAPGDPELLANLGLVMGDQGDRDAAIRTLRQALAVAPDHARSRYGLGVMLGDAGRLEEALTELDAAIRRDPQLADAQHAYGRTLARAGRAGEAIAALETAVRLQPDRPAFRYDLAIVLLGASRRDEAILHLEHALRIDPAYEEAAQALRQLKSGR